ncbi:MAG: hypothetical protein MHPSP_002465 [Paramarteilia canceri]
MDGSIVDFKTLGASVMHPGDQTDLQNFHLKTQKALWTDKKPLDSPKANEKLYNKQISELIATKMNFNFEQFGVNFAPLDDLIKILHQREEKNIISIDFMDNHTSIDHSMREILLDWLMELNSRVNALDDQCLWNFIMFSDQYSDQLIECINYSFPFTLSVAERDKNDASATFYINFQMVGEERNISNEIKTPLTNQIGPYDPQLLQKHSNEIELLKRVRVWQQRLRHCDSLAFLQQYFAEVSW